MGTSWALLHWGNGPGCLPAWRRWCSRTLPRQRTGGCFCECCLHLLRSDPAVLFSPSDLPADPFSPSSRGRSWERCHASISLLPASSSHLTQNSSNRNTSDNGQNHGDIISVDSRIFSFLPCLLLTQRNLFSLLVVRSRADGLNLITVRESHHVLLLGRFGLHLTARNTTLILKAIQLEMRLMVCSIIVQIMFNNVFFQA